MDSKRNTSILIVAFAIIGSIFVVQDGIQTSKEMLMAQAYSASYYQAESKNTVTLFSRGEEVLNVKNRLAELGYLKDDTENSYFGLTAFWALRRFQKDNGLDMNGVVNEATRGKLFPQIQTGFIEGVFSMIHADPIEAFSPEHARKNDKPLKSENWYYITTADKKQYELKLPEDFPIDIVPGTKIKVPTTLTKDNKIFLLTPEDIEVTEKYPYMSYSDMLQKTRGGSGNQESALTGVPPKPVEHKMLVVPVHVAGTGIKFPSKQNIYNRIFNGPINDFFEKNSYNKMTFVGDVADPVSTNLDCDQFGTNTSLYNELYSQADILDAGYDFALYLFFNCSSIGDGYSGVGFNNSIIPFAATMTGGYFSEQHRFWSVIDEPINSPLTNWTFFEQTLAHELGHALGARHSTSIETCPTGVYSNGNCNFDEYGNRYDVMGKGLFSLHFSGENKFKSGFIEYDELETIYQNGQYTIYPIESGNENIKLVKIANPYFNDPDFSVFIEKRKPVNYDNLTMNGPLWSDYTSALQYLNEGVFVYFSYEPTYFSNIPNRSLINLNSTIPFSANFDQEYDQKPLLQNESISFSEYGVSIQNLESDSNHAVVEVNFIPPNPDECEVIVEMVDGYNPYPEEFPDYVTGSKYYATSNPDFYSVPPPYQLFYSEEEQTVLYQPNTPIIAGEFFYSASLNSLIDCVNQVFTLESDFNGQVVSYNMLGTNFLTSSYGALLDLSSTYITDQNQINSILQSGEHDFYIKIYNADTNEVYFYKDFHINLCSQETGCSEENNEESG